MMTWIEATCPTCGSVEVTPDDIELGVCTNADASYYSFTCPVCAEHVKKKAEDRVIQLLIAEGVRPRNWTVPAEMLEDRSGPALTSDDVLDFLLELADDEWFSRLVEGAR